MPLNHQPYRRVGRDGRTSYGPQSAGGNSTVSASSLLRTERTSKTEKFEAVRAANRIDDAMGFARYDAGRPRVGWLINMRSTTIEDEKVLGGRAGVDFYFVEEDGGSFKATVEYDPYFLVAVKRGREMVLEEWIRRSFDGIVKNVKRVEKEDLQMVESMT
jgi:DNA polymerase epsilon subunit 1